MLLPEETADGSGHGPRIRRYRLASVGQGAARRRALSNGGDVAPARMARELDGLGRM